MMLPARPHRVPRRAALLLAVGALTASAVVPATASAAEPPSRLKVTMVLTGLDHPWDAAVAPGGQLLFTERAGRIDVLRNGQRKVLATPPDVVVSGEGGMLGIAVDPAFTTNRRIYTCYLSNAGTAIDVRVVRWRVTDDWKHAVEPLPIVTGIAVNPARQLGRHSGCRLRFHEGVLWITTGDAAIGSHPQDPQSLAGKVLRVGTDGSPAAGNMGAPFRPEIYAYGFRNPQGLAFRPSDGQAFIIEHGPNRDDEITPLQPGGNGGWDPAVPGNPAGYDESVPMTDTTAFPDALRPAWQSGSPTIAPSGGTFLTNPD